MVVLLDSPFSKHWLTIRRTCTLHGRILSLRQEDSCLHYRATWPQSSSQLSAPEGTPSDHDRHRDTEMLLKDYLNLSPNVKSLYEQWSLVDANFKRRAPNFTGVRILRQDPWEALVGFICSSNNNIVRISQMVRYIPRF
jgi:N-glycosylase/DNA lyase